MKSARARRIHALTCFRSDTVWLGPIPCGSRVRQFDQASQDDAVGEFVAGKHRARRRLSLFPGLLWGDHQNRALDLIKATVVLCSHRKDFPMRIADDRFGSASVVKVFVSLVYPGETSENSLMEAE